MAYRILKQTETLAVVKVWGTNTTDTITLDTMLLSSTMILHPTTPRSVGIGFVNWYISSGAADKISVIRNAVPILDLYQNGCDFDFMGNGGFTDDTESAANLVVNITGTGGCYLTLRKLAGYMSKIEAERFGSYDNVTTVGS